MDQLCNLLKANKTVYTPSLGLSQCLATVSFHGEIQAKVLEEDTYEIQSVIPLDQINSIRYEQGKRYTRFRIPERMRSDRTVEKYGEVIIDEDAEKTIVDTSKAFKVEEEHVLFF